MPIGLPQPVINATRDEWGISSSLLPATVIAASTATTQQKSQLKAQSGQVRAIRHHPRRIPGESRDPPVKRLDAEPWISPGGRPSRAVPVIAGNAVFVCRARVIRPERNLL
jgi:hypothetical protein